MSHSIRLLLVVTTICQFNANAQNEYFANNPIWGISQPCQLAPFEPESGKKTTYFIDGDTLLNDEVYVKIYELGFTYYGTGTANYTETPYSNPLPLAFLRSEEMKMFMWNEEQNIKMLLYDFDVVVGEQFDINPAIYPNPLQVESISYITLGGIERKVITVLDENPSWEHIYIEGVGHWRGIWHPNEPQLDCQIYLTCFSLNGESYVVNTDKNPWLIASSEDCEFVVDIEEMAISKFKVYPNPTSHVLNIQCATSILSIEISDPIGRIAISSKPKSTSVKVNTESLSPGCYFLFAIAQNGAFETMKFIKD